MPAPRIREIADASLLIAYVYADNRGHHRQPEPRPKGGGGGEVGHAPG